MEDRSKWTLKDYRDALGCLGAKTTGRKADLEERYASYLRNSNFKGPCVILSASDPLLDFPPAAAFRGATGRRFRDNFNG